MQRNAQACSKCEYELTGLGMRGRCPECGEYFNHNTREGVTETSAKAKATRWVDTHLRTITLFLTGLLLFGCVGLFSFLFEVAGDRALYLLAVLTAIWAFILVASYVNDK